MSIGRNLCGIVAYQNPNISTNYILMDGFSSLLVLKFSIQKDFFIAYGFGNNNN